MYQTHGKFITMSLYSFSKMLDYIKNQFIRLCFTFK
jgi:hypothetical protein